jgi:hypothetical protein
MTLNAHPSSPAFGVTLRSQRTAPATSARPAFSANAQAHSAPTQPRGRGRWAAAIPGTTLIFPANVPAAARYAEEARQRGEGLVIATSVRGEETINFENLTMLPSIYDADFVDRLRDLIATHRIERIFSPVAVVRDVSLHPSPNGRRLMITLSEHKGQGGGPEDSRSIKV